MLPYVTIIASWQPFLLKLWPNWRQCTIFWKGRQNCFVSPVWPEFIVQAFLNLNFRSGMIRKGGFCAEFYFLFGTDICLVIRNYTDGVCWCFLQ